MSSDPHCCGTHSDPLLFYFGVVESDAGVAHRSADLYGSWRIFDWRGDGFRNERVWRSRPGNSDYRDHSGYR